MSKVKIEKLFKVDGITVVTPKGQAQWCKIVEPEYTFDAGGTLSSNIVYDSLESEGVPELVAKLEALRDDAFNQISAKLPPAKAKTLVKAEVYKMELTRFDKETGEGGEETGRVVFNMKLKDVDGKKAAGKPHTIEVRDASRKIVNNVPLIGNGSTIRLKGFAVPYHMASSNTVGVSIYWNALQLIELVEFSKDSTGGFDEEEGFTAPAKAEDDDFTNDDASDF